MAITYLTVNHLSAKQLTRFFSKIKIDTCIYSGVPCWTWTAFKDAAGYGKFKWKGKHVFISRFIYAWLIAPVPSRESEMEVDHLCKNRACCNPVHLELVPRPINRDRSDNPSALNKRKTHCKYNHEFTPENTFCRTVHKGRSNASRVCIQCVKNRAKTTLAARLKRAKQRYATDREYRTRISQKNAERHQQNMQNSEYREKRRLKGIQYRQRKKAQRMKMDQT